MLEELKAYGFDDIRAQVLEKQGKYVEAAELVLREGNHVKAISLFGCAGGRLAQERAIECLLDALWIHFPLGCKPSTDCDGSVGAKLLEIARTIDSRLLKAHQEQEVSRIFN